MDLLIGVMGLNEAQALFAGAVAVVGMAFPVLGLVIAALSTVVPLGCHLDSLQP